ncbi:DUF6090 family protein [Gaetbulibacter sp. M240]|uniref:DUF6090 family protein n=1 Tax=Gaetbulibacter sp. M240 TaxID=3126511 RepID=UPI00374EAD08
MIKFFRKIRQDLLSKGKTGKYFKYAIGEIVLVVIGILIALYINNIRENLLQKHYTIGVFEQIRKDLVNDTLQLSIDFKKIKHTNELIIDILENNVPDSFYSNINVYNYDSEVFMPFRSLATDFINFQPNNKGYDLLKTLNNKELVNDSLTNSILSYYSQLNTELPEYNKVTVELSKRNIQEYKQYVWFENWAIGKYDYNFIEYLKDNEDNRKRLAEFYTYNSVNENYWKRLKQSSGNLINLIDNRIKDPKRLIK